LNKKILIDYGQLHPEVLEGFKLDGEVFVFEGDVSNLKLFTKNSVFKSVPENPPQIEDLTLVLPEKTRIGEILNLVSDFSNLIDHVELKDVYKDSYTFRIWYQDAEKTLTNLDVENIRNGIIAFVKTKFGATINEG
jgi:phenylalanyl-tRNA synthetase beta subunit